jgi:membrane dipeptidase
MTTRPSLRTTAFGVALLATAGLVSTAHGQAAPADAALVAKAKAIHAAVFTVDTHVDINPSNFTATAPNYAQKLPRTQVDLAKMEEGGMSGAFLIVYVGQTPALDSTGYAKAHASAMAKFEAIHRHTEQLAPDRAELALSAADARRIQKSGKRAIFIGIENGYPIGTDLANVKKFYDLGGRYMSLAHNGHSQLSDSNTGERDGVWLHNGLSPLGRQVIAEMNRLGMMIDISHPSKASMMQTLQLTTLPIIASHSGVRALCNHSRNLDDEQLVALAKNGGVAQMVAFNSYVKCDAKGQQVPGASPATVADFADHIDYAVKKMGIDHVGISSDFDGGGGVDGFRNAGEALNVTIELVKRGYTEEQIRKIWGGNLLRVLEVNGNHGKATK